MNIGILMLVLTFADGGQLSAAFVNTPTMADCERRATAVRAILEKGGTRIERILCRESEARFEPFVHGDAQGKERQSYLIRIGERRASVQWMAPGQACRPDGGEPAYCATSAQKLLAKAQ
ncbi:hypothetical protein [Parapusillimonas granuli]|uniref:Uncharacterized protein n=1 Tax=Parapusillimonas granuli TaxID=380911 RepID=A0A853FZX1_9BURK|nr:hypothetical protein [Parapusillimonas granuli]MBB5215282.1 hypothetical protein [Parapusillimonas granuli]MEB2398383.1 hypothetical protein [Alcaligenaceae bacterium]NYT49599.1 hypothetical protein [Parapusillimonas granuli]